MACLTPSLNTTIGGKTFSSSTYASSFSFKSSQVPISRNRNHRQAVSCKTLDRDDHHQNIHHDNAGKLDRRNVLVVLGGLYGAGTLTSGSLAYADPIIAPDVTKCSAADLPQVAQPTNFCPPPAKKILDKIKKLVVARANEQGVPFAKDAFPASLDKPIIVLVPRPKISRSEKEKEEEEEILVIEGIELKRDRFVKFDVFLNDEDDEGRATAANTEYAGSFVNVPRKHNTGTSVKTNLRIGISELLGDLEAEDDDNVLVTLVPRYGGGEIIIEGIKIEHEN